MADEPKTEIDPIPAEQLASVEPPVTDDPVAETLPETPAASAGPFERPGMADIIENARKHREENIREAAQAEVDRQRALGVEGLEDVPEEELPAPEDKPEAPGEPGTPVASDDLPDDAVITVKVFGEDKQVTLGELRKNAQMYMAGEEHFARAKAAAAQPPAPNKTEIPAETPSGDVDGGAPDPALAAPSEDPVVPDLDYGEIARTLQVGSEDEAKEALQGLVTDIMARQRPNQPNLSQEEVTQQVIGTIVIRQEMAAARNAVAEQYPELVSDPDYLQMSRNNYDRIIAENDASGEQPSYSDVVMEAARRTAAKVGLQPVDKRPVTSVAESLAERIEAKRGSSQPPPTASVRSAAPRPERQRSLEEQRVSAFAEIAGARKV